MTAAHGLIFAGLAATALALTLFISKWAEERRWARPIRLLAAQLRELGEDAEVAPGPDEVPELAELSQAVRQLRAKRSEGQAATIAPGRRARPGGDGR